MTIRAQKNKAPSQSKRTRAKSIFNFSCGSINGTNVNIRLKKGSYLPMNLAIELSLVHIVSRWTTLYSVRP